jgi:Dopey, N-terminal
MIRALASALEDEHLLVKRGVLDLLDQSLRMESPAFKKSARRYLPVALFAILDANHAWLQSPSGGPENSCQSINERRATAGSHLESTTIRMAGWV